MEMDVCPSLNFKIATTSGTLKNRNNGKPTWNEEGMEIEAEKAEVGVEVECLGEKGRPSVPLGEKLQTIGPMVSRRKAVPVTTDHGRHQSH